MLKEERKMMVRQQWIAATSQNMHTQFLAIFFNIFLISYCILIEIGIITKWSEGPLRAPGNRLGEAAAAISIRSRVDAPAVAAVTVFVDPELVDQAPSRSPATESVHSHIGDK